MRGTMLRTIALMTALLGAAGCATSQEMATWRAHSTHFASGDHLLFSMRNDIGSVPRVTREDLREAQAQAWWGDPVVVSSEHIVAGQ